MGTFDINKAEASDSSAFTDYSVDTKQTDGGNELRWTNTDWGKYLGYYKKIPELRAVIDAKATWTIGKGIKATPQTTFIMDSIKGINKDSFSSILENLIRTMQIGGDSYAEIIRNDEGEFINLKPLDPSTITIITNKQGLIKKYEQNSKTKNKEKKTFETEEIFHLIRNRVADEIHGTSLIEALEWIILAKNESMADNKLINHRFAYPRWIFHLDTDDTTKVQSFKATQDAANANGENMYIPKDAVVPELMGVAPNSTINLLPWLQYLDDQFYLTSGVPKIILGGTGAITEAAVKIAYLAFQQTIEEDQLAIEEQVGLQLGLAIELEFPASLENELLSDNQKDGAQNIDPSETTAGQGQ